MTKLRKKGFTLIELIAVLVIMAILALIVTPLVMNIIRKARIVADKRSIDAYGRSIEYAIASYLLDNGKFPTSVGELSIEYSGDEVICSTTQLNDDSSVYLTGCTVKGRSVDYAYGDDKTPQAPTYPAYSISQSASDTVTYNGVSYYVIEDSGTTESTVKLLKAEPLNEEEVSIYSNGTGARISGNGMQYHSSSNAYDGSYIKTTVDAWKAAKAPAALEARLITFDELVNNLGYEIGLVVSDDFYIPSGSTPNWVYNTNCWYWTMTPFHDALKQVWGVKKDRISNVDVYDGGYFNGNYHGAVRPVIVLPKSELQS